MKARLVLFFYTRTKDGVAYFEGFEVTLVRPTASPFERFKTFFDEVPTNVSHEWNSLTAEEITAFFRKVAADVHAEALRQHDRAVEEYKKKSLGRQWIARMCGQVARPVPSEAETIEKIIVKCLALSQWLEWMKVYASAVFYQTGADKFIEKPREVARLLSAPRT